jgi:hypothetical protein
VVLKLIELPLSLNSRQRLRALLSRGKCDISVGPWSGRELGGVIVVVGEGARLARFGDYDAGLLRTFGRRS